MVRIDYISFAKYSIDKIGLAFGRKLNIYGKIIALFRTILQYHKHQVYDKAITPFSMVSTHPHAGTECLSFTTS